MKLSEAMGTFTVLIIYFTTLFIITSFQLSFLAHDQSTKLLLPKSYIYLLHFSLFIPSRLLEPTR